MVLARGWVPRLLPDGSADGRDGAAWTGSVFAGLPRLELGLLGRAARGVFEGEAVAGLAQPRQPTGAFGQLHGHLVTTTVPEHRVFSRVDPSGVGEHRLDRGGNLGVELLTGSVG